MKKENLTFKDGFDSDSFMRYMEDTFEIGGRFGIDLIQNIVDYAHKHEHVSKDQFAYFLSDLIPEIEFEEVAAFCEDCVLTSNGIYYKNQFWEKHGDK